MITQLFKEKSLSFQAAALLVVILLVSAGAAFGSKMAMAASLKQISVVSDDVLRLGDVFDNISRNADYVLGAAPKPGEDMVLNARTLYRIASAMDVEWRPATSGDSITIRREANIIPFDIIPWFLVFPALGFGLFGLKGPPELKLFTTSFLNHLAYGFGLWWIAKVLLIG